MIARSARAAALGVGLAATFTIAGLGSAQPPPGFGSSKTLPDPTVPSAKLKSVLSPPKAPGPAGAVAPAAAKQAELRLRGRVIAKDKALVVLEVNGQTFVLPVGGEANLVRVVEITAVGVTVEVGSGRELKILH